MYKTDKQSYFDKPYYRDIKVDAKLITDAFNIVSNMDINNMKQFMILNQIPYNIIDMNGNTLIHRVLLEEDILKTEIQRYHMIRFLYNENTNPDAPNNNNITPFHIACIKQYFTIIQYFVELGVDVNYQDNFGNTPLHKLFTGNIKLEEKIQPGNLLSYPRKQDMIKTQEWIEERKKIWDAIKDTPFIKSIDETLKNSIGNDNEELLVVKDYLEQVNKMELDLSKPDELKQIKELKGASINRFKNIIEKKWSNFTNINDIMLHVADASSYPENDPSKFGVIKNANVIQRINNTIDINIRDAIKLLNTKLSQEIIHHERINNILLEYFIREYYPNNLTVADYNDPTKSLKSSYDTYNNNFKHELAYDFADNIMDITHKTFMGGARRCEIINEFTNIDDIKGLLDKSIDNIIPILVYTLVVDFNVAITFTDTYNLSGTVYYDKFVKYLVGVINDNINIDLQTDLINNINTNIPHQNSLVEHIKQSTNSINWIYGIITQFLCNHYYQTNNSIATPVINNNLQFEIRMPLIYFIAGLINKTSDDLKLSISQVLRPQMFNSILLDTHPNRKGFSDDSISKQVGSVVSAWLYCLLSVEKYKTIHDNIIGVRNDTEIENHINNLSIDELLKDILKDAFNIDDDFTKREELCKKITNYYMKMEQKPQELHIADIIYIIRHIYIGEMLIRMDRLIIPPISFNNLTLYRRNIQSYIEPRIVAYILSKRDDKLFKILGKKKEALNIYAITEYALPSRVNYFIYNLFSDIKYNEDMRLYTLKYIESYYLGLNFIGHIKRYTIENDINILGTIYTTDMNLFNFNNKPPFEPNLFNTNDDMLYNRSANIISVLQTINQIQLNINKLLNYLNERFKIMFENLFNSRSSSLYATIIGYLYPLVLVINNYNNIFMNINKSIVDKYKENISYIPTIAGELNAPNDEENYNQWDILNIIKKYDKFELPTLEKNINMINGNIFMLYYFTNTKDYIKIPKFIYHILGFKPLVVYDKEGANLNLSKSDTEIIGVPVYSDTSEYDNTQYITNRDLGLFRNVITNIGYINKKILNEYYITSKNMKLPPSLQFVLYDFYKYNIINVIKNTKDIIKKDNLKDIQLKLLQAKIIEELIQLFLRNRILIYAVEKYDNLVKTTNSDLKIEKLFEQVDFSVILNQNPKNELIDSINTTSPELLKVFYSFVEPKEIKHQYYIYPDNYFNSTRLNIKYTVNINQEIIKYLLDNGTNLLLYNHEKSSPLIMFIKNYYYEGLGIVKQFYDFRETNNNFTPINYLLNIYINHVNLYDNFTNTQYNEIVQIIQANDTFYNNILKYMEVSFKTVMYITEQYLAENILRFSDDFSVANMNDLLKLLNISDMPNFNQLVYNNKINNPLEIPKEDYYIIIQNIKDKLENQMKELTNYNNKYNIEKKQLKEAGLSTDIIDKKITYNIENINKLLEEQTKINNIKIEYSTPVGIDNNIKIINRYDEMLNKLGNKYLCYMDGWRQLVNLDIENNIDRLPTHSINLQKEMKTIDSDFINNIHKLYPFYKHNYNIVKNYFEKPRYLIENKVLGFVNDLLIHLTKIFICSNIESIIKKILYESIVSVDKTTNFQNILDKIDYISYNIKDYLYDMIPKLFVKNSVSIYKDYYDETEGQIQTVAEILNSLIDLLKTSSPIDISDYTISLMKDNIVPYFDTIIYKLINNWNVVIENIFTYHINHYRILECFRCILLSES